MIRIKLICAAGMSTSLLVVKMNAAAICKGVQAEISAIAEADLKNNEDEVDVVLLGPQVKFMLNKIKPSLEAKGVKVDVINMADYGTMNGENVLNHALALVDSK